MAIMLGQLFGGTTNDRAVPIDEHGDIKDEVRIGSAAIPGIR